MGTISQIQILLNDLSQNIESSNDYAFFCTRLSEIMATEYATKSTQHVMTPAQAVRAAVYLLRQAIPKLPKEILRKYFR